MTCCYTARRRLPPFGGVVCTGMDLKLELTKASNIAWNLERYGAEYLNQSHRATLYKVLEHVKFREDVVRRLLAALEALPPRKSKSKGMSDVIALLKELQTFDLELRDVNQVLRLTAEAAVDKLLEESGIKLV